MNKEIKSQWTEELKSGRLKQSTGRLRREEKDGSFSYCCLGVLCEIHRKFTGNPWHNIENSVPHDGLITEEVRMWSGLDSCDPHAVGGFASLATLNDQGKTFAEIADIIERDF